MPGSEWKQFQDRVAEMEPLLTRGGAQVESPARIPDKDTGRLREVDVLVRLPYAHRPVLMMIECRRHNARQDVRWIEQLAQKRDSVGADRVVAVSRSPFTEPAQRKAAAKGVELRTLSELDADVLLGEAYSLVFCFDKRNCDNMHVEVECGPILESPATLTPPMPSDLAEAVAEQDFKRPVFIDVRDGQMKSIWDVWTATFWSPVFEGLVPGGAPERRTLQVRMPGNPPPFRTTGSDPFYLWEMHVTADFSVERVHLQPCASYEYRDEEGTLLRRLEWDLEPVGQPGVTVVDIFPPGEDGGMPFVPRFRQTREGSAVLFMCLEHDE